MHFQEKTANCKRYILSLTVFILNLWQLCTYPIQYEKILFSSCRITEVRTCIKINDLVHKRGQIFTILAAINCHNASTKIELPSSTYTENDKKKKLICGFFFRNWKKKPVYQLKGQAPKNKGRMNFKENCDLTKKYIFNDSSSACFFFFVAFSYCCNFWANLQRRDIKQIQRFLKHSFFKDFSVQKWQIHIFF